MFWLVLALLLAASSSSARKRENLLVRGTTVDPDFKVVKGSSGFPCPSTHPRAIAEGAFCCGSEAETAACGGDGR